MVIFRAGLSAFCLHPYIAAQGKCGAPYLPALRKQNRTIQERHSQLMWWKQTPPSWNPGSKMLYRKSLHWGHLSAFPTLDFLILVQNVSPLAGTIKRCFMYQLKTLATRSATKDGGNWMLYSLSIQTSYMTKLSDWSYDTAPKLIFVCDVYKQRLKSC